MLHITLPLHHFTTLDLTATLRHKAMPKQYETGPYLYFVIPSTTITSLYHMSRQTTSCRVTLALPQFTSLHRYLAALYLTPPMLDFTILRVGPLHQYNAISYRNTNVLNLTATISRIISPIQYLTLLHFTGTILRFSSLVHCDTLLDLDKT